MNVIICKDGNGKFCAYLTGEELTTQANLPGFMCDFNNGGFKGMVSAASFQYPADVEQFVKDHANLNRFYTYTITKKDANFYEL